MNAMELYVKIANRLGPRVTSGAIRYAEKIPAVSKAIGREKAKIAEDLREIAKPYRDRYASFPEIPDEGWGRKEILEGMEELKRLEEPRWRDGFVSGAVYHGDEEHIEFLNRVYGINSQSNPLHSDLWPSATKYEAEMVSMAAHMLGAGGLGAGGRPERKIGGVVTSGGTESILTAMKTYRDWARKEKKISRPEIVAPSSAHPAFDKAAQLFDMKLIKVPVGKDFRADVEATRKAINRKTAVLVGSTPGFPHGVIDPIEELSELARERSIGFHTDACLGGFLLPWAERLGHHVPPFDFRLPGVTSISADTHKYGYALKGTSVILYRGRELLHHQYFKVMDWSGGVYFTPTFAGSRPGALSAVCWAAMVSMGKEGYMEATRKILDTASRIKEGIRSIPGLHILGDPLWVIAFGSDSLDIYEIMACMEERRWNLNGLQNPPALHLCVTLRHTRPGVAERFVADLKAAVDEAKKTSRERKRKTPLYGMAVSFPDKRLVGDLLYTYLDTLHEA